MKILSIVAAAVLLMCSCNVITGNSVTGNGNIRTEKRSTGNFNTVKASGSIDIEISSGDTYTVSAEDDDNLLQYIVTDVNGGTLNVYYKNGYSINNDHAKVYITVPSLDKIIASGSADIIIHDILKNKNKIEIDVSGSGNVKGQLDAPAVSADVSGSGNINLNGRTKDFDCSISGSGDINCGGLQSENANVKVSGSGNAHVFASVHLTANIFGSGNVYYNGNSTNPEIHISGSGNVQPEK